MGIGLGANEIAILISARDEASGVFERVKGDAHGLSAAVLSMGAVAAAAMVGAGVAALKLGADFDAAYDTIRIKTGTTGAALEGLQADFKAVVQDVPTDFAKASAVMADLSTRTGATGVTLQDLTKQVLEMSRITGTDAVQNVALATRTFGDWGIATKDQGASLDLLFRATQATGIGIGDLQAKIVQYGAPLRAMNFSFAEATALLAKWEKEGVNSELVLGSLRIAMGNFAEQNIPMRQGLEQTIEAVKALGPGAEATSLTMKIFGARAGPDMAAAILEGRFAIDDLLAQISKGGDTILGVAKDTEDFAERWQKVINRATIAVEPFVKAVFSMAGDVGKGLLDAGDAWAGFAAAVGKAASEIDRHGQAIGITVEKIATKSGLLPVAVKKDADDASRAMSDFATGASLAYATVGESAEQQAVRIESAKKSQEAMSAAFAVYADRLKANGSLLGGAIVALEDYQQNLALAEAKAWAHTEALRALAAADAEVAASISATATIEGFAAQAMQGLTADTDNYARALRAAGDEANEFALRVAILANKKPDRVYFGSDIDFVLGTQEELDRAASRREQAKRAAESAAKAAPGLAAASLREQIESATGPAKEALRQLGQIEADVVQAMRDLDVAARPFQQEIRDIATQSRQIDAQIRPIDATLRVLGTRAEELKREIQGWEDAARPLQNMLRANEERTAAIKRQMQGITDAANEQVAALQRQMAINLGGRNFGQEREALDARLQEIALQLALNQAMIANDLPRQEHIRQQLDFMRLEREGVNLTLERARVEGQILNLPLEQQIEAIRARQEAALVPLRRQLDVQELSRIAIQDQLEAHQRAGEVLRSQLRDVEQQQRSWELQRSVLQNRKAQLGDQTAALQDQLAVIDDQKAKLGGQLAVLRDHKTELDREVAVITDALTPAAAAVTAVEDATLRVLRAQTEELLAQNRIRQAQLTQRPSSGGGGGGGPRVPGDPGYFGPGDPGIPGGGGFPLSPLPRFATGGVVPGPVGVPRLVVAEGGEVISAPGGGGGVTIQFHGPVYGWSDFNAKVHEAVQFLRDQGRLRVS